ncbi:N-formylglutamate amidohydrolase [Guptibacillus hwajinpoensis]|uniref:N-formylglutamate amidohydrolase n=1 Tax=Guptibacillus hwajinpoensis TaxID=208199 RepID=A0A0J6CKY8_9BACL|nr:N-formylglutamate amidohydrolase [Alkalihalobacillus macyae]KMM36901.1 hypothetical protein AB986_13375 [Alkalihalobacillus macyae]
MAVKFIQKNYVKYNLGNGYMCCHVEALHATPPAADLYTDLLVRKLIQKTGSAGIISTVSRTVIDLNRPPTDDNQEALTEYRKCIEEILNQLGICEEGIDHITVPYLHLSFHGMKDTHFGPLAIEIGTSRGRSCSKEVKKWFEEKLTENLHTILPNATVIFDNKFAGNKAIHLHRVGDGEAYKGYKENFHSFQIELSRTIRKKHRTKMVQVFSNLIDEFQLKFVLDSK